MACLDPDTVDLLVVGQLEPAALAMVDVHLDACPGCRSRVASAARKGESVLRTRGGETSDESPRRPPRPGPPSTGRDEAPPSDELAPAPDPHLNRVLAGRYRIVKRLGGGGMGSVYEAEHALIGRRVAVKLLHAEHAASREVVRRFQNEARAAATLGHPGILQALDMGRTEDGMPFLVLELLEGRDLDGELRADGPLPIARAVGIALDVADAISAAHAAGIVHRDLKPENVFLTKDGRVKVLDFGISKVSSALAMSSLTAKGAMMGTPHYMAPEQFEDAASADPRADVYALGVMLYRTLTGRFPFQAGSLPQLLLAIVSSPPPSARDVRGEIPPELASAIQRAMSPTPADRFESMAAFAAEISPFRESRIRSAGTVARSDERRVATVLVATGIHDVGSAEHAVREAGGRIARAERSELVALFGGDTWLGDEARRAVDAALALRSLAEAVAVASGHITQVGGKLRGEPIERAASACDAGLAGVAFVLPGPELPEGYPIREVTDELVEVTGPRRAAWSIFPTLRSDAVALVGRDAEIAQLEAALDRTLDEHRPSIALVTGAAGMGKTRLVAELVRIVDARHTGARTLVGRSRPGATGRAGLLASAVTARGRFLSRAQGALRIDAEAPMDERREAVRALAREAAQDESAATSLAEFLGEIVGVPMPASTPLSAARASPRLMADRTELALREYIVGLAGRGPVVLVLEDLQWADARSLSLLAEIAEEAWDRPMLIVGTARDDLTAPPRPFDADDVTAIKLHGIGVSDVRALAIATVGRDVPESLARSLHERTLGTPFFLEQILAALADDERLDDLPASLPLPIDVEAAVQGRLDALPSDEREAMKRAAVLGRVLTAEDVEALGVPNASVRLDALARRGLLRRRADRAGGRASYEQRSSLVSDVAYRMMTDDARIELHRKAGAALAARGDADPEMIGEHLERGREPAQASREFARAALMAARHRDTERVLACSARALALASADEDRFALLLARAEAFEAEGRLDEEATELELALAAAATAEERALALTSRGALRLRLESPRASLPDLEHAVGEARASGEPVVLARALGRLATALVYAGQLGAAAGALAEAERLVATRAPALRPDAAIWRAQLAGATGDLGARQNAYWAAVELYQEAGDLRSAAAASVNLADALNRFGAYEEAERALREALDRCRRMRLRLMEGYALANLGYALAMSGRTDDAAEAADAAGAIAMETGDARLGLFARLYLARVRALAGDAEAAIASALQVASEASVLGLGPAGVLARALAAFAELSRGHSEAALALTTEAMSIRGDEGIEEDDAELFVAHARALEAAGHRDDARRIRDEGRRLVMASAARIGDPTLRERFLASVAANRELAGTGAGA